MAKTTHSTKELTKTPKSKKKAATRKKAARKKAFRSGFSAILERTPIPIRGYDAAFNPETGKAMVRIVMSGGQKEFRDLAATDFASLVSMLNLPGVAYNGQYVIASL